MRCVRLKLSTSKMFNHGYFLSFTPDFFEDLNMLKNEPLFSFFGLADATSAGADVVRAVQAVGG